MRAHAGSFIAETMEGCQYFLALRRLSLREKMAGTRFPFQKLSWDGNERISLLEDGSGN